MAKKKKGSKPSSPSSSSKNLKRSKPGIQLDLWFNSAWEGDVVAVRGMINEGIPVNAQDDDGNSALILASAEGHEEVVDALVECEGIDVNMNNDDSALFFPGGMRRKVSSFSNSNPLNSSRKNSVLSKFGNLFLASISLVPGVS